MSTSKTLIALLASATLIVAACGDEAPVNALGSANPGGANAAPKAPAGAKGTPAAAPSDLPPLPVREFHPRDFDETELSRDPFRTFEDLFRDPPGVGPQIQREVLASKYTLDQLKIIGLVGGGTARVMMADPSGFGWVIKVGDFVGRPEIVRTGGPSGNEVAVNWRLDRIRTNDAVFLREDPTRPDVPATTRVVTLRTDAELNPEIRTGIRGSGNAPAPGLGEAPPLGPPQGGPGTQPAAPPPAPAPQPAPKPTG